MLLMFLPRNLLKLTYCTHNIGFDIIFNYSGNFFQIGESAIMSLELNYTGNILYSAVGNSVKMVDLKT